MRKQSNSRSISKRRGKSLGGGFRKGSPVNFRDVIKKQEVGCGTDPMICERKMLMRHPFRISIFTVRKTIPPGWRYVLNVSENWAKNTLGPANVQKRKQEEEQEDEANKDPYQQTEPKKNMNGKENRT